MLATKSIERLLSATEGNVVNSAIGSDGRISRYFTRDVDVVETPCEDGSVGMESVVKLEEAAMVSDEDEVT